MSEDNDKPIKIPRYLWKALAEQHLDPDNPAKRHTADEAWAKYSKEKLVG